MTNTDARIEALLNSLVGCDFLVTVVDSGLSPEDLADPKISLSLAASSADSVNIFHADHELLASELPPLAREKADQARAIIEHPGTAWWFNDIDLDAQAWASIDWTAPFKFIYGTPPNTMEWKRPQNPSGGWERKAQKPYFNQHQTTSTLYGPNLTSELVAYDNCVGDYYCDFPLAWWKVHFLEEVRVFEIHGPADWYDLCVKYPAKYEQGQTRLVPSWGAVAEEWDGVHLSFGGLLTAEQNRHESISGWKYGWAMLNSWHAEQTYWLRPLKTETEVQPDFLEGMGYPEIEGYRSHRIDWDTGTLLTRDDSF